MKPKFGWDWKIWAARLLIGGVLGVNVQCAILFLLRPDDYVAGFELFGASGLAMLRSLGLLFLMWNVPYAAACWRPQRLPSLLEALVMQALGLVGEIILLFSLPAGHIPLTNTALRFIVFDAGGLILLLAALLLIGKVKRIDLVRRAYGGSSG